MTSSWREPEALVVEAGETILEIRSGQRVPAGYEIRTILTTRYEPWGETVYIVAALFLSPAPEQEKPNG